LATGEDFAWVNAAVGGVFHPGHVAMLSLAQPFEEAVFVRRFDGGSDPTVGEAELFCDEANGFFGLLGRWMILINKMKSRAF